MINSTIVIPGFDLGSTGCKRIMYWVYILSSRKKGTLYIGLTRDLKKRIWLHKNGLLKGFTKKYEVKNLVYFEEFEFINDAIWREKNLKSWNRQWKIDLIEERNPEWNDLYVGMLK